MSDEIDLRAFQEFPPDQCEQIEALVRSGGQVYSNNLTAKLQQCQVIGAISVEGVVVSIAALKAIRPDYVRKTILINNPDALDPNASELGYVVTANGFGGRGYARRLCEEVVAKAPGDYYATVVVGNDRMEGLLLKMGLVTKGKAWRSDRRDGMIGLWVPR